MAKILAMQPSGKRRQDFLGMDSCQFNETNKKGSRRIWTTEEEYALIDILEDLVAKGYRHENGTFKSGLLSRLEKALHKLFPGSGLKAKPHIESKMKILKKQFRIVYEMANKPGFKWNDEKKCVMVDTEKTWKAYLKHHKEADGWRGKFFPLYDRLGHIFKADCAVGERYRTSPDIVEELNRLYYNTSDDEIEKDTSPRSVDQVSTNKQTDQSHSSPSKRRRDDDTGGSSHTNETNEKNGRDLWTKEEEDVVLRILEDLVAKGLLYDNGTFRNGTYARIGNVLRHLCPASGLKTRDIESKVKEWKRECNAVCDMLNRTGFSWNDVMKCVEVDSGETWKAYVQDQMEADKWRGKVGKHFPIYDRLTHIFDVGCATVKTTQTPAEIVEEINCFKDNSTDIDKEEDTCPRSADQLITKQTDHSHSLQKKRRREDDTGGSSHIDEPIKRIRRTWTEEEEDALLGILEDLVAKGHRYEKGTFKPGTSALIEDALSKLCPGSGLKVHPHVESKIKKLKQECSIVCDMLKTDGFSWNNEMKCVEVDSETWKRYVKHHKEADKWRGKFFPIFDRLIYIFQMGHPIGKTTQTPAEVEEMNCFEFNTTGFGTGNDTRKAVEQASATKDTDQSYSPPSKRRKDDMGGLQLIKETKRKRRRRKWTKEEEDALLGILEDLVAKGHRFHKGTFTSGTLTLIENGLFNLCPASGLKAYPHIESKLKKLKKGFRTVCDILNSGFGWNDKTKCVVVECEESWKGFVKHHREAGKWRYKQFPLYDILARIFGADCTNVKASQAHIKVREGINIDEVESSDVGVEEDTNSRSVDRISTNKEADCSHSPQRNGRRKDVDLGASLDKVAASVLGMMQTSKEQMRVLIENLQSKDNNESLQAKDVDESLQSKDKNGGQQSKENRTDQLRSELIKLGLSITDRVKALRLLMADTWNADFFLTLDEDEKLEFVKQLIDESSKK